MGSLKEGEEVGNKRVGQLCPQEVFQYFIVRGIAQCYLVQVILFHKAVEHIGTQHHCFRYLHAHARKLVKVGVALYHTIQKRQATTFSAQRSLANAGKV